MICVGIDVAKEKHDCFIINSEGVVLADVFTIPNDMAGFNRLRQKIQACSASQDRIKVGLEAKPARRPCRCRWRLPLRYAET